MAQRFRPLWVEADTMRTRFLLAPLAFVIVAIATPGVAAESREQLTGPVRVEIFEDSQKGRELIPDVAKPTESYAERAFGFVRVPTKYSANALPLDRSNPYTLRAAFEGSLPAGK